MPTPGHFSTIVLGHVPTGGDSITFTSSPCVRPWTRFIWNLRMPPNSVVSGDNASVCRPGRINKLMMILGVEGKCIYF